MSGHTNDTNRIEEKIIYKDLSYQINGVLFKVHKKLGRFCREKQYGDIFEELLKETGIPFSREQKLPIEGIDNSRTNVVDFCVNDQILVDLKAKPFVTKEDYYQMQRYLQAGEYKLGLLVNFRNSYLKPIRVIRLNS